MMSVAKRSTRAIQSTLEFKQAVSWLPDFAALVIKCSPISSLIRRMASVHIIRRIRISGLLSKTIALYAID